MNSDTVPVPGISGKKFTVAMIGAMAVTGGWLAYELAIYEKLDRARAKSAEHWRVVAAQLDDDYKRIEAIDLSAQTSIRPGLDAQWLSQFRHDASQFRTATNMDEQLSIARKIESNIQSVPSIESAIPKLSDALRQQVEELNTSIAAEQAIQRGWSGKIVQFFIRHPIRSTWEVKR